MCNVKLEINGTRAARFHARFEVRFIVVEKPRFGNRVAVEKANKIKGFSDFFERPAKSFRAP
jgi:hypothetical protein